MQAQQNQKIHFDEFPISQQDMESAADINQVAQSNFTSPNFTIPPIAALATRSSPRLINAVQPKRLNLLDQKSLKKNYLTCTKAKRAPEDICVNCKNPKRKKRCMFSDVPLPTTATTNFPSPPTKINTRTLDAPLKASQLKELKREYWRGFVTKCMEEEATKRVVVADWWKIFNREKKETNYGSRVALMKELGCKLFCTEDFFEVIAFLYLYYGYDGKKRLAEVVKIQDGKPMPVKISARQVIKLKCVSGGSWAQNFAYKGALNRISGNKIQFASQSEVVQFKRSLRCPRIHKYRNPSTGHSMGRYCKFKDILEFTYSTPSIVKHMNFFFPKTQIPDDGELDGVPEEKLGDLDQKEATMEGDAEALYAIYADGSKQTKMVEITCFCARNLNLGRITRDPAAMQIILLDTAKECIQFFDSVFVEALMEGIKDATENGVWVICTELFRPDNTQLENGELVQSFEGNSQCQLCLNGDKYRPEEREGVFGQQFYHNIPFRCLHIYDRKAMNLIRPVKPCICHICLEELRSVSWQECFKLQTCQHSTLSTEAASLRSNAQTKKKKRGAASQIAILKNITSLRRLATQSF